MNASFGRNIYIYDQLDTVEAVKILGMVHYAANELKCKHIVIDSLMKCGINGDDYNAQKKFVDRLCWAAKRHNVHIHLVAHVRKAGDETHIPGKFDVSGTADLSNLVDNLFITWANKRREEIGKKMDMGLMLEGDEQDYYNKSCDQILAVEKQRDGEWEGKFKFWFHGPSLQFTPDDKCRPLPYELPTRTT
jgi:twinkle protein